ncbi:MAG TPA: hypothetical protein VIC27_09650 [Ktedonobacterales bacterium]
MLSARAVIAIALVSLLLATGSEQAFMRLARPDAVRVTITAYQWNPSTPGAQEPPVLAYDATIHNQATATQVRDLLTQIPHVYYGDALCGSPPETYDYDFSLFWHGIPIESSRFTPYSYDTCGTWTVSIGGLPDLLPRTHTLGSYDAALRGITDATHAPYLAQQ